MLTALLTVAVMTLPWATQVGASAPAPAETGWSAGNVVEIDGYLAPLTGSLVVTGDGGLVFTIARPDSTGTYHDLFVGKLDADGNLDPDFGDGGIAATGLAERPDGTGVHEHGMAVDASGMIYVAGVQADTQGNHANDAPAIVRLDPDGSNRLGPAFFKTNQGVPYAGQAVDVEVHGGHVYLFAMIGEPGAADVGFVEFDQNLDEVASEIVRLGKGRKGSDGGPGGAGAVTETHLYLAVQRTPTTGGNADPYVEVIALRRSDLGTEFTTSVGASMSSPAVEIDESGRVLVATDPDGTVVVRRLDPVTGAADSSFGGGDPVTVGFVGAAHYVDLQPLGGDQVLVGSVIGDEVGVAMLAASGSPNPAFGTDGIAMLGTPPVSTGRVAVADGGLDGVYVATSTSTSTAIVRLAGASISDVTTTVVPQHADGTTDAGRQYTPTVPLAGLLSAYGADPSAAGADYRDAGYNLSGYNLSGYNLSGYTLSGYTLSDVETAGYGLNGYTLNPYNLNGYNLNGYNLSGYNLNGYNLNGYGLNGYGLNGYGLNGYTLNPYNLNGYNLNGYNLNPEDVPDGYEPTFGAVVERANPLRAIRYDSYVDDTGARFLSAGLPLDPFVDNDLLNRIPVSELQLSGTDPWPQRSIGTSWEGVPANSVSFGSVLVTPIPIGAQSPAEGIGWDNLRLDLTPIADAPLVAVLLAGAPLTALPPPAAGDWGAYTADPASTTLLDLALAGVDLGAYLAQPLSLRQADLTGTPLARARLIDLVLWQTAFRDVLVAHAPGFVTADCLADPGCVTLNDAQLLGNGAPAVAGLDPDRTVGDLLAHLLTADPEVEEPGKATDVFLHDVLGGFAPSGPVDLGALPRDAILDHALLRTEASELYAIETSFTAVCGTAAGNADLIQLASRRSRYVPGTATLTVGDVTTPLPDPVDGVWHLSDEICPNDGSTPVTLSARYEPDARIGTFEAVSLVFVGDDEPHISTPARFEVVDGQEVPPGSIEPDIDLVPGLAIAGFSSYAGDLDVYAYDIPADMPIGTRLTFTISATPVDVDVVAAVDIDQTQAGYDLSGYNLSGYNLSGYNLSGYNLSGYNLSGYNLSGTVPDATDDPGFDPDTAAPDINADLPLLGAMAPFGSLRGVSANRGLAGESVTVTVRAEDRGRTARWGVAAYDGGYASEPALAALQVNTAHSLPACIPSENRSIHPAGTLDPSTVTDQTETLILTAPSRLAGVDPGALAALAAHERVNGAVLAVDGDPDVAAAYAAWDAAPCSVSARNAVVAAILEVIAAAADGNTALRHVVVVGGDLVIPQYATVDGTSLGNEAEYAAETLSFIGGQFWTNPTAAAFGTGHVLTDDALGSPYAIPSVEGGERFVPILAVGRLVEGATEINGLVQDFLDSDGIIPVPTGAPETEPGVRVFGYDFLADGAEAVFDAMSAVVAPGDSQLVNDTWNKVDAEAAFENAGDSFLSINGHYSQTGMLPAQEFYAGSASIDDVLFTTEVDDWADAYGSTFATVGCHAGLLVDDAITDDPAVLNTQEWAQDLAIRSVGYAAMNIGFGYGDTEVVGGSERLFKLAAENLRDAYLDPAGGMTIGQAYLFAKHEYLATSPTLTPIREKVATQLAGYGLPMYTLGAGIEAAPSLLPTSAPSTGANTQTMEVAPTFDVTDTGNGVVYSATSGSFATAPVLVQDRPIGAGFAIPVDGELPIHGVLIEELSTFDGAGAPGASTVPAIHTPATDSSESTRTHGYETATFPVQLTGQSRYHDRDGIVNLAHLAAVQWDRNDSLPPGHYVPSLVTSATLTVGTSDSSDYEPPVLSETQAVVIPDGSGTATAIIQALVDDPTAVGHALIRADADTPGSPLHRADFVPVGGGRYVATITGLTVTSEIRYVSQFHDEAFNVGWSGGKSTGHVGAVLAPQSLLSVVGTPVAPDVYTTVEGVQLDGDSDTIYVVRVDGQELAGWDGGLIPVPTTDGIHFVEASGDDGSEVAIVFVLDTTGPVITATRTPTDDPSSTDVTFTFACADAGAGVAPDGCPDDVVFTGDGEHSATVTATDLAGLSTQLTVTATIDATPPEVTATAVPVPNAAGWNREDVVVTFSCTDSGTGIADCPEAETVTSDGTHTVTGTATDLAGNTASASLTVRIDTVSPTIEATPARPADSGGWYTAPVSVDYTCADPGPDASGVASCPSTDIVGVDGTTTLTHTVVDLAGNVASVTTAVQLDQTAPTITATVTPEPTADGWHNGEPTLPTVTFSCTDPGAEASGLVGCTDPVTVYTDGVTVVMGTATDAAGNETTIAVEIRLDSSGPSIEITSDGPLHRGEPVTGIATTVGAGISQVYVTYTSVFTGRVWVIDADLSCNAAATDCTFSAKTPGRERGAAGYYSFTATAVDEAGNSFTTDDRSVTVN